MVEQPAGGRTVTLVVCDGTSGIRGQTAPVAVATPWWQDLEPIRARFGQLIVLRVLYGRPTLRGPAGGDVTYLAELPDEGTETALRELGLAPSTSDEAVLEDHPLRMPWAKPGGPGADLAWATDAARRAGWRVIGAASQHRTWNLSAIWSLPAVSPDGARDRLWLKCVPPFFAHEASVLRRLAGEAVPVVVASEDQRMLLAHMPGRDGFGASVAEAKQIAEHLVALQARTTPIVDELLSVRVPDSRATQLLETARSIVTRRAPQDAVLHELVEDAEERLSQAQACGLPDVLVHGDAHPGNSRLGAGKPILFDWGDCRIGNPTMDLDVLDRLDDGTAGAVGDHWLDCLALAFPGSRPARAWWLLRPLAALRAAAVYQGFLDNIEPSERVYHEADVAPALERAARLTRAQRQGDDRLLEP